MRKKIKKIVVEESCQYCAVRGCEGDCPDGRRALQRTRDAIAKKFRHKTSNDTKASA